MKEALDALRKLDEAWLSRDQATQFPQQRSYEGYMIAGAILLVGAELTLAVKAALSGR